MNRLITVCTCALGTIANQYPKKVNVFIFQGGNLNVEDDFESEYLRYGGTVGVRNPRLVAAMRGVPPYQQQHIQMNMLARY